MRVKAVHKASVRGDHLGAWPWRDTKRPPLGSPSPREQSTASTSLRCVLLTTTRTKSVKSCHIVASMANVQEDGSAFSTCDTETRVKKSRAMRCSA